MAKNVIVILQVNLAKNENQQNLEFPKVMVTKCMRHGLTSYEVMEILQ